MRSVKDLRLNRSEKNRDQKTDHRLWIRHQTQDVRQHTLNLGSGNRKRILFRSSKDQAAHFRSSNRIHAKDIWQQTQDRATGIWQQTLNQARDPRWYFRIKDKDLSGGLSLRTWQHTQNQATDFINILPPGFHQGFSTKIWQQNF